MDNYALKQQLIGELKETLRIKQLNLDMMDMFEAAILYILSEADKNKQTLPNAHRLHSLIKRIHLIYNQLYPPTKFQQPKKTPSDSTIPYFVMVFIFLIRFSSASFT